MCILNSHRIMSLIKLNYKVESERISIGRGTNNTVKVRKLSFLIYDFPKKHTSDHSFVGIPMDLRIQNKKNHLKSLLSTLGEVII